MALPTLYNPRFKTVKRKIMKVDWEIAKAFFIAGFLFWLIETIYFLIAYGWHYNPINEAERSCDYFSCVFYCIGGIYLVKVIYKLFEQTTID